MRIGVFSDSHGDSEALDCLLEKMGYLDAVCFLGDVARDAQHLEDRLAAMPNRPVLYAVRGNNDYYSTCMLPWDRVIELDGEAVGRIKGWEVSPYNGYVQLGYDIAPEKRCQGLMTEAVGAVARYLLLEAEANRVYCSVREDNAASRRVCEKNGFRHEGVMRQHYARQDGGYDDVYIYGLLRADLKEE